MYVARQAHIVICWLYLMLLPVQFALAGYGVMGGNINTHEEFGGIVLHGFIPALLLITAGVGFMGWVQAGWSFGLFAIITLQIALVEIGRDLDKTWVSGLHPAVALLTWPYVYFIVLAGAYASVDSHERDKDRHRAKVAAR